MPILPTTPNSKSKFTFDYEEKRLETEVELLEEKKSNLWAIVKQVETKPRHYDVKAFFQKKFLFVYLLTKISRKFHEILEHRSFYFSFLFWPISKQIADVLKIFKI